LGFDEDEIDLMAFMALSHRGGRRQKYADIYDLYEKSERIDYRQFQILGLILATSEILESRRQGAVLGAEVKIEDQEIGLTLEIKAESSIDHEISHLGKISKKFGAIFGHSLGKIEAHHKAGGEN
jgi:hypothetical protein